MNIRKEMTTFAIDNGFKDVINTYPDVEVDAKHIKTILINEVVPTNIEDDFFGNSEHPYYLQTTIPLFLEAGVQVKDMQDILEKGIYITNVIRKPKVEYEVGTKDIQTYVPLLEKEISLFPNLQVIMLMGDVAKKAVNMISKKATKKPVIPSMATYKLRKQAFYYHDIRVFPSYIMTGKNILIEKSKFQMASEDIANMMDVIR